MKQGKALTREQKILLSNAGWNPKEWSCIRDDPRYIVLKNKQDGTIFIFNKEAGK
jgi:hypothetical protein